MRTCTHVAVIYLGFRVCTRVSVVCVCVCVRCMCTWECDCASQHVCGAMTFLWMCVCLIEFHSFGLTFYTCISIFTASHHLLIPLARFSRLFSLRGERKKEREKERKRNKDRLKDWGVLAPANLQAVFRRHNGCATIKSLIKAISNNSD